LLLAALAVSLTVASGAIHGHMTSRWSTVSVAAEAGRRLELLPEKLGSWKCVERLELTDAEIGILESAGYVYRVYEDERTGDRVKLLVIVGPAAPTSVHTPEVCYPSRDYHQQGERVVIEIPNPKGEADRFWNVLFREQGFRQHTVLASYAWHDGTGWVAAEHPRYEFVGYRHLYKMQLTFTAWPYSIEVPEDACRRFLKPFARAIEPCLEEPERAPILSWLIGRS
jgi:hypothetical protein